MSRSVPSSPARKVLVAMTSRKLSRRL
jgi:hypothetical protein